MLKIKGLSMYIYPTQNDVFLLKLSSIGSGGSVVLEKNHTQTDFFGFLQKKIFFSVFFFGTAYFDSVFRFSAR